MQYSKIGIGAVQFGLNYGISNTSGQTSIEEVKKIVDVCKQYEINTIDTSDAYGNSEEVIGKTVGSGWFIISKFSASVLDLGLKDLLKQSLSRLHQTSLEGYLAHDVELLINNPSLWDELLNCREKKLVKKIGYSIYTPKELEELLNMNMVPDILQVPFNFLDKRFLPYFSQLKNLNVEIHTRSAFLQGLFFLKPENLSPFFDPIKGFMNELKKEFNSADALAGALLNYCIGNKQIDKVIIGVNTSVQLKGALKNMSDSTVDLSQYEHLKAMVPEKDELLLPYKWPSNK